MPRSQIGAHSLGWDRKVTVEYSQGDAEWQEGVFLTVLTAGAGSLSTAQRLDAFFTEKELDDFIVTLVKTKLRLVETRERGQTS